MSHWKPLFRLKCEDYGVFFTFYSKLKEIIHELKKGNSVAATDNIFLKAYFSMVIEAPELQSEVRNFLKGPTKTYSEILESIHDDCRAQTTGKDMKEVPRGSSTISIARRGTVDISMTKVQCVVEKEWRYVPFPTNVGQLILAEYYM